MNSTPVTGSPHVLTAQWVLPVSGVPIKNGFVAWENDTLAAVGPLSALPSDWRAECPKPGSLLTPGLINCHAHLEQSFPRPIGKAPEEPFTDWLLQVVALLQRHADSQEKMQRCRAGAEELLRTGTTCVNDIASGPESLKVLDALGLRGIVSLEVFHPAAEPLNIAPWVERYRQFASGFERHSRLGVGLSPHSPYNVSPAAWQALIEACQPALIHTHLAEFIDETRYLQGQPSELTTLHQTVLQRTFTPKTVARSPVAYLQVFQLLNDRTLAAHAIEADAADRQVLQATGVTVAHCPRSNVALHGKTLAASDWEGLPMGLGTDGRLSTDDLDLRNEARFARQQHGWVAQRTLEAMTLHGAQALHLERKIGSLEVGKQADVVLWQAEPNEMITPEEQILAPQTTVESVWIAGAPQWPHPKA